MILPVCCFVAGLIAMGRTKPTTKVYSMTCMGPKSGAVYQVEDFREIGVVVVRSGKSAVAQFARASIRQPGTPGLIYQHGRGEPRVLKAMVEDFGVLPAKPAAASGKQAGSQKAAV